MGSLRFIRSALAVSAAAALAVTYLASGGAGEPAVYATLMGVDDAAPAGGGTHAGTGAVPAPLFSRSHPSNSDAETKQAPPAVIAGSPASPPPGDPRSLLRPVALAEPAHATQAVRRSDAAAASLASVRLAGEIQRHLKRLGCYAGPLTGDWDAATRAGMSDLLKAVNARLSVKQADVSLLALALAHEGSRCASVVAARQATDPATLATPRPAPMPGLMAIGGPRVEPGAIGSSASPEPGASVAQHAPSSADAGLPPPISAAARAPTRPRGETASRRQFRHNSDTFFTHPLSRSP